MTLKLGIGYETDRATWEWVGFDPGRELSKYFDVEFFSEDNGSMPKYQMAVFVKKQPLKWHIERLLEAGGKFIYIPVDNYERPDQIESDAEMLKQCSAVVIHCERLRPYFEKYCKKVVYIDHHNRFGLNEMVPYRRDGHAVWIGCKDHLKWAVEALRETRLGIPIHFVTGPLDRIHITDRLPILDDHRIIEWNPRNQEIAMRGARCAFDIKGNTWQQMMKPATKAQKYIMSGIPTAVNPDSYSYEYFLNRGMKMQCPSANFSTSELDYKITKFVGEELRNELTLQKIGEKYRDLIKEVA